VVHVLRETDAAVRRAVVKNIRVTLRKRTPYSTASKQIRVYVAATARDAARGTKSIFVKKKKIFLLFLTTRHSVKTPGGRLVAQYISKRANGPKCGDCGTQIHGVCAARGVAQAKNAIFFFLISRVRLARFRTCDRLSTRA